MEAQGDYHESSRERKRVEDITLQPRALEQHTEGLKTVYSEKSRVLGVTLWRD